MKKIVVTGGMGFIGGEVVRQGRNRGYNVVPMDRSLGAGHDILGDLALLHDFKPEVVIHLAGMLGTHELFDTPQEAITVNVSGTLRILQWCRSNGAGYVGITMPDVFPSVYTATKQCAVRLAGAWHREYGVPVSHVRAFNVFGPRQAHGGRHPQKIIPTFAVKAWNHEPIPVWGDGEQGVDLIDVHQTARLLLDATEHGDDVVFDAGTGTSWKVITVADMVIEYTGSNGGIEHLPMRRGEIPTQVVARGEGWERLDWQPTFDLEALQRTLNAYHPGAQSYPMAALRCG